MIRLIAEVIRLFRPSSQWQEVNARHCRRVEADPCSHLPARYE